MTTQGWSPVDGPDLSGLGGRAVDDEQTVRAVTTAVLTRWPCAGVAVAVVRAGRPPVFHVRGVGDAATWSPVTPETVFRIGSLTKVVTALAVLRLWEEGRVDLDAPANEYLRAFHVTRTRPTLAPCTVRHLLTHTSGIGYWRRFSDLLRPGPGSGVQADTVRPLAEVYRRGLPQEVEPGTKWAYSNHAFAALGQVVEDVSGEPLGTFYRRHLLEPLGMRHTSLSPRELGSSEQATGYVLRRGGLVPVPVKEVPAPGSGGLWSTPADLARLLAFLLDPESSGVLRASTVATMFAPHFQPDPRLPGMGLAFELGREAGRRTASKTGTVAGFHSMLALAPDEGTGVVVLTNTGGLDAQGAATPLGADLLRRLLGLPADPLRTDLEPRPETWSELTGWYAPVPGPVTNLFTRAVLGAGAEVTLERRALVLKPLSPLPSLRRGVPLHRDDPEDPYVFRADLSEVGMGSLPVVFGAGAQGRPHIFFDLIELDRRPDLLNPRRLATGALLASAGTTAAQALRRRARRTRTLQEATPW